MKLTSLLVVLVAFLVAPAARSRTLTTQYSSPLPGKQVVQSAVGFDYWLYLPQGYEQQENWPLVIFLHGAGAKNIAHAIENGTLAERVQKGADFPFILASPFYNNKWWSTEELIVFVDAVAARYKTDLRRIYITGLSMGAYGTWELACRYPDRFAAALPICGGGTPKLAARMKDIPVWTFHGALDGTVPVTESQKMVDALREAGGTVEFTILPKAAHVCWPEVYRKREIYDWLLSHVKATPAPIDRQAELRYRVKQDVRCDFRPLMSESSTVGRLMTELTVSNALDAPLEVTGTLSAAGIQIIPSSFQLSVAPRTTSKVPFEVVGADVGLDSKPTIQAKWSTLIRRADGTVLTLDTSRHLPINPMNVCAQAVAPVIVDGELDEWTESWIEIPRSGRNEKLQTRIALSYGERAVYVAVRTIDDVVETSPKKGVWEQDGLEVRFDFRQVPRAGLFRDWEEILPVLVSPSADPAKPILWRSEDLPAGVQVASKRTAAGYDTEIAVSMSYVQSKLAGKRLEQFRLNLCVNDADAKRQVTKNWWNPDWRREDSDDGTGTFSCQ